MLSLPVSCRFPKAAERAEAISLARFLVVGVPVCGEEKWEVEKNSVRKNSMGC